LRARTHFQRCRVRRVPFSCFALPESFSTVLRASGLVLIFSASGLVFMFCGSGIIFSLKRGRRVPFSCFVCPDSFSTVPWALGPVFMFCRSGIIFGGTEGVESRCQVLRSRTRFRRYRARQVPFSCFALSDSFSAAPRASGPVFLYCAP
jgi:hypothetical protein